MGTSTCGVERTAQSEQVARRAAVVSLGIMASRITGLAREMFMAHQFGAGFSYDAFLLGFRIPNLSRDLFAEGALSFAFVPAFTTTLARGGRREAARLANAAGTLTLLVVGLLCVCGMLAAPQLVSLLAPGFALVPGKFALAVRLTRVMFPFLLLVALASQAAGILNSCGTFGVPALASAWFNIGSVVFGIALGFWWGSSLGMTPIEGMAYAVVIGGALQLAWQIPRLRDLGFTFRPEWNWSHPALRQILSLMAPAILANAAVQINVIVNTSFASRPSSAASFKVPSAAQISGGLGWTGTSTRSAPRTASLASVSICGGLSMRTTSCSRLSRSNSPRKRQPETSEKVIAPAAPSRAFRNSFQRVRLFCGSMSSKATRRSAARAAARLAASVVLPAPPFCCATVMTVAMS